MSAHSIARSRFVLPLFIGACGFIMMTAAAAKSGNIPTVAMSNSNLSTLVKALKAADMVDTLKGPGPFTVLAPTDAAFNKIPKAELDALFQDKAKLKRVLAEHVINGE